MQCRCAEANTVVETCGPADTLVEAELSLSCIFCVLFGSFPSPTIGIAPLQGAAAATRPDDTQRHGLHVTAIRGK